MTESLLTVLADKDMVVSLLSFALAGGALLTFLFHLRAERKLNRERLDFEKTKFKEERAFRDEQYRKFRDEPNEDIARYIAEILRRNPDWARQAMEDANLASYTYTIFGERSHHFAEEKRELAKLFSPYLLARCRRLIEREDKSVYLLIDAGTTLYPFFKQIGRETARAAQSGEDWVGHLHLATNNLPGLEELMKYGRRVAHDRYSKLAIRDCHLLPGIPLPVFAAVAGKETKEAIKKLRTTACRNGEREPAFLGLVVGNWVRVRRSVPRCPVPMARGREHCEVKDSLVGNSDEVFVVAPLGKTFIGQSESDVNSALGFSKKTHRPERMPYQEVTIGDEKARRVKLISTYRTQDFLLYAHSVRLEEGLLDDGVSGRHEHIGPDKFAGMSIEKIPHLLFEFSGLPQNRTRQMEIEFPHYSTRQRVEFCKMFHVRS